MRRILGLLIVAAAALAFLSDAGAAAQQTRPKPLVYVINWRGCEQACKGLLGYFEQNKLPVELVMRDAQQQRSLVGEFVREARSMKPDVIVTWGNDVTLEVIGPHDAVDPARHVTDIPVVYMYVSQPIDAKIAKADERTGRRNVAGTDYVVPLSAQVNAIAAYRPLKRLGILFDETQPGSVQRKDGMQALAGQMGYTLVAVPIPLGPDGKPAVDRLGQAMDRLAEEKVDFVYFGVSTFLIQHMKAFTRMAVDRGIPVFSGGQLPVENADALFAFFTRLEQIGALAGYQVERILKDPSRPAGELSIARLSRFTLLVNMRVARDLRLYPPVSMARIAEFIDR